MNRLVVALAAVLSTGSLAAAPKLDCSIRPPKGTAKADLPRMAKVGQVDAQKAALASKGIPSGASVAEAELDDPNSDIQDG